MYDLSFIKVNNLKIIYSFFKYGFISFRNYMKKNIFKKLIEFEIMSVVINTIIIYLK